MKRFYCLLVGVIVSLTLTAATVTVEQAERIARQFVQQRHPATSSGVQMAMQQTLPMSVAADASAYYVFNIGANAGFVVVSGSDLTSQVLGYADKGTFDKDRMPDNMRAWLASYSDQIAYVERTLGRHQAPRLQRRSAPVAPLLASQWNQDYPYYNNCPMISGSRAVTGCVATALAQVINYYKYPAQTIAPIPGYTTKTYKLEMPQIPATAIDWDNMLEDYSSGSTQEQRNAVAQLMLLCGQAVEMDYAPAGSGAVQSKCAGALQNYFGYDKTVRSLDRTGFSASEWESIIYGEIASGRPVIYGGQSTGGGHSFVVDGCDGEGLFHVNWGWGGANNGYFLLSVLNPYNNEAIGSSSSRDGYSFSQDIVVGIQHGTGETVNTSFTIFSFGHEGSNSYTRASSAANFRSITTEMVFYNMTGATRNLSLRLALVDAEDNRVTWITAPEDFGEIGNNLGYGIKRPTNPFGAGLADGDYYIVPFCTSDGMQEWIPCFGSGVYRIKANISGNTLTLTDPTVALSGTLEATGSTMMNKTVALKAQITNSGTNFNDYVYLLVDNTVAGGRIFEVAAGQTATLDIDFLPAEPGTKQLTLAYEDDNGYVPFATGSVNIESDMSKPYLIATLTLTNANANGNVEDTAAKFSATIKNEGAVLRDAHISVALYKKDPSTNKYQYKDMKYEGATIATGGEKNMTGTFDDLEVGGSYAMQVSYTQDWGNTWVDIDNSLIFFDVVEPSTDVVTLAGTLELTNADESGVVNETTARMKATITNTSTVDMVRTPVVVDLYKYNTTTEKFEYVTSGGFYMTIAAGQSDSFTREFTDLEQGAMYGAVLSYSLDNANWTDIEGSEVEFRVAEAAVDNDCKLDFSCTFDDLSDGVLTENTLKFDATFTNTGSNDYDNVAEMVLYNVNSDGSIGEIHSYVDKDLKIAVGESKTLRFESVPLTDGNSYVMALFYCQNKMSNTWTYNNTPYRFTVKVEKEVVLTADNKSRTYGDDNPTLTYTKTGEGTLEGTPTISTVATSSAAVGTYDIVIDKGTVTNKKLTLVNGTLTVTKAPLTVTVGNYTRKEGEENPQFELTYQGWKLGENESVLAVKPVATTTATVDSPAGEYPIVVSGGDAQNYEFTYVAGVLTIEASSAIGVISTDGQSFDVYTPTGLKVRTQTHTLQGLPAGVYIVNGRKVVVK